VRVELRQATSPAQLAALRAGQLDLALVHQPPSLERELVAHRVLEEPYRLACERASTIAHRPLTPARLAELPWIAIAASTRAREDWIAACGAGGFAPRIAVEVADWASALALVDAGAGVALVPASVGRTSPGVVLRAVPWLRMRSSVWLVRRADASPLVMQLEQLVLAREHHPLSTLRRPRV
jgi:DNA-binding transcriptional LysR family regulator